MERIVLKTKDICKKYGNAAVLKHIDLSLSSGHIYGFIGENGAGKTTLLRIITGLTFPTSGEVTLFGEERCEKLEDKRKLIGSTIEAPALYPGFTAEKNLDLQRILIGNPNREIIDKALEVVGLKDAKRMKVKNFSMGMKQRLGIAMSLVGKPEMLILDEPINGLDPKGIAELRTVLLKLNQEQNMTILLSSHILNELYRLATDYIIIHEGSIVETLTHEELDTKCGKYIAIQTDDASACAVVLERELKTDNFKVMPDGMIHLFDYIRDVPAVAKVLHENNILVTHMALSEQSLEEYYFTVTGGQNNGKSN